MAVTTHYNGLNVLGATKAAPNADVVPLVIQRGTDTTPAANLLTVTNHAASTLLSIGPLGGLNLLTSGTAIAPLNIPPGSAPTSPVNGDVWTTSAGIYTRVAGVTVGPLGSGGGTPATTVTTLTGLQAAVVGTATNYAREDHQHAVAGLVDFSSTQSAIGGAKTFTANLTVNTGSNAGNATVGRLWLGDSGATPTVYNGPTLAGTGITAYTDGSWRIWSHNGTSAFLTLTGGTSLISSWYNHAFLGGLQVNTGFGGSQVITMTAAGVTNISPTTDVVPLRLNRGSDSTFVANILEVKNAANAVMLASISAHGATLHAPDSDVVPLVLQRGTDSSPAANLLTINNHAGTQLVAFNSLGNLTLIPSVAGEAPLNLPHGATVTSPTDGDLWTTTNGLYARINGATAGPFGTAYSQNEIDNGNFQIWQRGTASITCTLATNVYTADRWFVNSAGAASTAIQSTTVPTTNLSKYSLQVTGNTSVTTVLIAQRVETLQAQKLRRPIVLTFQIYNATGSSFVPVLQCRMPTVADNWASTTTATSMPTLAAASTVNGWNWYSVTVDPSASNFTTPGSPSLGLEFGIIIPSGSMNANTKSVRLAEFKVEVGTWSTQPVAPHPADDLKRCLRYYWRVPSSTYFARGNSSSTTVGQFPVIFPSPMRVAPTSANSGATGLTVLVLAAGNASTAIAVGSLQPLSCLVGVTTAAVQTAGHGVELATGASGWIEFTADL